MKLDIFSLIGEAASGAPGGRLTRAKRLAVRAACGMALLLGGALRAESEIANGVEWTYSIVGSEARIYAGEKTPAIPPDTEGEITIPNTLGGCPVKIIGSWAFYGCDKLDSVVMLSGGVTTIEAKAFYKCSLTSVQISWGVEAIGDMAFAETSLEDASIPSSVTDIGAGVFFGCASLRRVDSTASMTSLPSQLFEGCTSLASVSLLDDVAVIGPRAFFGCASLESFVAPANLTTVAAGAFKGCSSLKEVWLPDGVLSVAADALADSGIESAYVTEGKTAAMLTAGLDPAKDGFKILEVSATATAYDPDSGIDWGYRTIGEADGEKVAEVYGDGAAAIDDSTVGAIFVPETLGGFAVTRIGDYAFLDCSSLTSAQLPATVTRIGCNAFESCSLLETVNIPDGVDCIGENTFYGCEELKNVIIPGSVTKIGGGAFYGCEALPSIEIGEAVKTIGDSAFCDCYALTSIGIPAGVREIGNGAFSYCDNLEFVSIGNGVAKIGSEAFYECDSLKSISIPDSVTNIGAEAFYGCDALESVEIGDGVEKIGDGAFSDCTAIESLTVPQCVCSKADAAACTFPDSLNSVKRIELGASVTSVAADAFRGFDAVTGLAVSAGAAGGFNASEAFPDAYDKFTDVAFADGAQGIGEFALSGCSALTDVTIPASAETIGGSAFAGCVSLAGVDIPEGVTTIEGYAFSDCTGLTDMSIPGSVTTLGYAAFENCPAICDTATLPGVTLVDGWAVDSEIGLSGELDLLELRGIGGSAFAGRGGITAVTFPDNLQSICAGAFASCTGLTEVMIPDSVASIGAGAFSDCANLKKVTAPAALKAAIEADATIFQDCSADLEIVYHAIYTVTFDANGGDASESSRNIDSGTPFLGDLPEAEMHGYDFDGWYTAADGGEGVTPLTVVTADVTYYAHWLPVEVTVMFDANGGVGGGDFKLKYGDALVPPVVTKEGFTFTGWSPTPPDAAPAEDATYTAQWTEIPPAPPSPGTDDPTPPSPGTDDPMPPSPGTDDPMPPSPGTDDPTPPSPGTDNPVTPGTDNPVTPGTDNPVTPGTDNPVTPGTDNPATPGEVEPDAPATPAYDVLEMSDIVEPYAVISKAVTISGAVYEGADVVGIVQLKLGKVNASKKTGKVSGSFVGLDGKKRTIKGASLTGVDGTAPVNVSLDVKDIGTMTVAIGGEKFAGSLGDAWHVQTAEVGGDWKGEAVTVSVAANDMSMLPGIVLTGLMPDPEEADAIGGKWKFPKAASVKWSKPKKGAEPPEIYDAASGKGLIIDTGKGKTNLSAMKLTYTPKKGTYKGSFKVYALQGEGAGTKLKKYSFKVSGVVVGGKGHGEATSKNPAASWKVTVK